MIWIQYLIKRIKRWTRRSSTLLYPKINYAVVSEKGMTRTNNEDNFYLNGIYMEREEMDGGSFLSGTFQNGYGLYAVCDGMGGWEAGEDASYQAVKALHEYSKHSMEYENLLVFLHDLSGEIYRAAKEKHYRSGTTIALVLLLMDRVCFVNIGDSRIYLLRDDTIRQISVDHTRVQRLISLGLMTQEQARKDPARHVITQFLGMEEEAYPVPNIVEEAKLEEGDIILLCSDGLTDKVEDAEIERIVKEIKDPEAAVKELERMAYQKGSRDNITIMILRISKENERENTTIIL